jgi:hypothetical protein
VGIDLAKNPFAGSPNLVVVFRISNNYLLSGCHFPLPQNKGKQ